MSWGHRLPRASIWKPIRILYVTIGGGKIIWRSPFPPSFSTASASQEFAEHFSLLSSAALHSYDPDSHSCAVFLSSLPPGIPFFFFWIVRKYKKKKKMDDENVKRIIGWMHRPYKKGCEYWLSVELLRKLILTGCIGFMVRFVK